MTRSGSEAVAARLAHALDIDDVYTYAGLPGLLEEYFGSRHVRMSRAGASSFARRRWSWLLPVMASWWRRLDLSAYDAIVTSSHSTVNAVRAPERAPHIAYCHTPMRYAWTWRTELGRVPAPLRPAWPLIAARLRTADRRRAENVDLFIANSHNVAGRIERFYGRRSIVVYPPVDTSFYTPDASVPRGDFFLYAGRLVAYKEPNIAVRAANASGANLVIAGGGPELDTLRRIAGETVRFVVEPDNEHLRDLYRRARALVFPGDEDFGMTLVEAQACGTPVIAAARGGALEAVRPGVTGELLDPWAVDDLTAALRGFDSSAYDPAALVRHAAAFSSERFDEEVMRIVRRVIEAQPHQRAAEIDRMLAAAATQ